MKLFKKIKFKPFRKVPIEIEVRELVNGYLINGVVFVSNKEEVFDHIKKYIDEPNAKIRVNKYRKL